VNIKVLNLNAKVFKHHMTCIHHMTYQSAYKIFIKFILVVFKPSRFVYQSMSHVYGRDSISFDKLNFFGIKI
jgi:hypothetical protein